MSAYYNEIDPFAAQWLRNLIDAGYVTHWMYSPEPPEEE